MANTAVLVRATVCMSLAVHPIVVSPVQAEAWSTKQSRTFSGVETRSTDGWGEYLMQSCHSCVHVLLSRYLMPRAHGAYTSRYAMSAVAGIVRIIH